jgi:hypothetical protein
MEYSVLIFPTHSNTILCFFKCFKLTTNKSWICSQSINREIYSHIFYFKAFFNFVIWISIIFTPMIIWNKEVKKFVLTNRFVLHIWDSIISYSSSVGIGSSFIHPYRPSSHRVLSSHNTRFSEILYRGSVFSHYQFQ